MDTAPTPHRFSLLWRGHGDHFHFTQKLNLGKYTRSVTNFIKIRSTFTVFPLMQTLFLMLAGVF